jgi:hypothetical protein
MAEAMECAFVSNEIKALAGAVATPAGEYFCDQPSLLLDIEIGPTRIKIAKLEDD